MKEAFDLIRGFIQPHHRELFQLTPFNHLFNALLDEKVNFSYKRNKPLDDLIMRYSRSQKGFHIGNDYYFPSRNDVQLIFGINDGHKQVRALSNYSFKKTSLKSRLFHTIGRADVSVVKMLLQSCSRKSDPESCSDMVKLLCLLLLGGVFFANLGQTIAWAYFWFVDDFQRLCSYDWCSYILQELQSGLNKPWDDPRHVNGCTLLLWYWLCEHTTVIRPLFPLDEVGDAVRGKRTLSSRGIPRLTKWILKNLYGVISDSSLSAMSEHEFHKAELEPTVNEVFYIPSLHSHDRSCEANSDPFSEDSAVDDDDSSDDELILPPELLVDEHASDEHCVVKESSKAAAARVLGKSSVFRATITDCVSVGQCLSDKVPSDKVSGDVRLDVSSSDESEELISQGSSEENSMYIPEGSSVEDTSDSTEGCAEAFLPDSDSAGVGVAVLDFNEQSSGPDTSVGQYILKARSHVAHDSVENILDGIPDLPLCELLTPPPVYNAAQVSKSFNSGCISLGDSVMCVLDNGRKKCEDIPSFDLHITPPAAATDEQRSVVDQLNSANLKLSTNLERANSKVVELQSELAQKISMLSSFDRITLKAQDFESQTVHLTSLVNELKVKCVALESTNSILEQDVKESTDQLLLKQTEIEELKADLNKFHGELLVCKATIYEQDEKIKMLLKEQCAGLNVQEVLNLQVDGLKSTLYERDGKISDLSVELLEKVETICVLRESLSLEREKIRALEQKIENLELSLSCLAPECFVDTVVNGSGSSVNVASVPPLVSSPPKRMVSTELGVLPFSIERGVKDNPRKRGRSKLEPYHFPVQKKKTKISCKQKKCEKQPFLKATENPVDESGKLVIYGDRFLYPCREFIPPDVFDRLQSLNAEHGKLAQVFFSDGDVPVFVNLNSVMFILNNLYVDAAVLDGLVALMKRDGLLKDSNFLFSSVLSNTVMECVRSGKFEHQIYVQFFSALVHRKKIIFPYCCSGKESRPYHWVVLSYQLGDTHWKLYHSAPVQRGSADIFVKECDVVLFSILQGIEATCDGFPSVKSAICTKVMKTKCLPLQDTDTNCCLYAAYFLYKLARDSPIPRVLEDEDVQKWKATLVNSFVLNIFQTIP